MSQTNRYPMGGKADFRTPKPRPRPANTNRPPVRPPMPANDNWALPPRPGTVSPVYPGGLGRYARLLRVARPAARMLPAVGWLFLAWDLYELWRWYQAAGWTVEPANYIFCSARDTTTYPFYHETWLHTDPVCASQSSYSGNPSYDPSTPWFIRWQGLYLDPPFDDYRWRPMDSTLFDPPPAVAPEYLPEQSIPFVPQYPEFELPWLPFIDPMYNPVFAPAPRPVPVPIGAPRPLIDLPEASSRGYEEPRAAPRTEPRVWAGRPPARTKERKIKTQSSALRRFLGALLSNYSEAMDFAEAMHDALPKKYQATKSGQKEMLLALYRNLDKVNMADAVMNYLQNDQEDRIWGRSFGRMNKAFESYGIELPSLRL